MSRSFLSIIGCLLLLSVHARSCLLILRSDGRPTVGILARNGAGAIVGKVDGMGQLCIQDPPDTLVFMDYDLHTLRIAWNDAVVAGEVELPVELRSTKLDEVAISPWPTVHERSALAAVSALDSMARSRAEQSSLRGPMLWVPGVQMDERGHGGSVRLSIRGSLLRSLYGVRGVKVYWGPFPITLADGSTPLELLDPALVGSMDVVRSIGGPAFGSAPSGLILTSPPERRDNGIDARLALIAGPFGYYKLSADTRVRSTDGSTLSIGLLRLGNDGYRDQEYVKRDQVFLTQRFPLRNGSARIFFTFQKAKWGLPGSLDSLTAVQAPRSARPFSQLIDARVEKSQLFAGIAVDQRVWRGLLLRSTLQVQAIDKLNPYGTTAVFSGYKDEQIKAAGGRLSLGRSFRRSNLVFSWEIGLEALLERDLLNERAFAHAAPADVRTNADTRVGNLNGFLALRMRIADRTTFFADLGTEATSFKQDDRLRNSEVKDAPPAEVYPMFGVEQRLNGPFIMHLRYAESTSRPSIWEVLGSSGMPNTNLSAEQVQEAETGIGFQSQRSSFTMNGYLRHTHGMILSRPVGNGAGEEFINAGEARQNGVELTATTLIQLPAKHTLELLFNGAWQHHRLQGKDDDPTVDVPGVPRWSGGLRSRLRWRGGIGIELGYRANSSVLVNSMNGDRMPDHAVMQVRIDHSVQWRTSRLEFFILAENMLDASYSSFPQLNDPGRRYYNPAPARSVFAGISYIFQPKDPVTGQ